MTEPYDYEDDEYIDPDADHGSYSGLSLSQLWDEAGFSDDFEGFNPDQFPDD